MEQNRKVWNTRETTISYRSWARLTPTLTHIVTYELVTSGAEDDAMSHRVRMIKKTETHRALDGQVFTAVDCGANRNEVLVSRLGTQSLQGYARK